VIVGAAAGYLYYAAAQFEFHHRAGTLGPISGRKRSWRC